MFSKLWKFDRCGKSTRRRGHQALRGPERALWIEHLEPRQMLTIVVNTTDDPIAGVEGSLRGLSNRRMQLSAAIPAIKQLFSISL